MRITSPFPLGYYTDFRTESRQHGSGTNPLGELAAIRLIAIDIDSALLLPDHTIPPAIKNVTAATRARGTSIVLTADRPYVGAHNYLRELRMERPNDYYIAYNGALIQEAVDGSIAAQTALGYDDYRLLGELSREVGSHFHALDRTMLYTTDRDISYYTVHEFFVTTIPLVFYGMKETDPSTWFLKVMMIDESAILD